MTTKSSESPTKRLAPGTPVVHLGQAGTIVRVAPYRRNGRGAYLVQTAHGPEIWQTGAMLVRQDAPPASEKPRARTTPLDPQALAAPQVYQATAQNIAHLLERLETRLQEHAAGAQDDPTNWGRVGDLQKVQSDLLDLIGFLSGMERPELEASLAE